MTSGSILTHLIVIRPLRWGPVGVEGGAPVSPGAVVPSRALVDRLEEPIALPSVTREASMPAQDQDRGVDRSVHGGSLGRRQHTGTGQAKSFAQPDEVIHRDSAAAVLGDDPVCPGGKRIRVARFHRDREAVDHRLRIAQELAELDLAMTVAERRVALDRDLEGAGAEAGTRRAEPFSGRGMTGRPAARRDSETRVAHELEV
jgi:hypothetical protein